MKKTRMVGSFVAVLIFAGLGLAQDQNMPLGDVVRQPKTARKAKVTLTEEGTAPVVAPATTTQAAGASAPADASAPAASDAAAGTPATAGPAQNPPAIVPASPAEQKLLDLQQDEQKLSTEIARLQQRLQENLPSDARQAFQDALASDQNDLAADKKQEETLKSAAAAAAN